MIEIGRSSGKVGILSAINGKSERMDYDKPISQGDETDV